MERVTESKIEMLDKKSWIEFKRQDDIIVVNFNIEEPINHVAGRIFISKEDFLKVFDDLF